VYIWVQGPLSTFRWYAIYYHDSPTSKQTHPKE
jgi:hypothetical protein